MFALSLNQLTSSSAEASAKVSPSTTIKRNRPKTARIKTTKFRKTGFEEDEENDGAPPSKKPASVFPSLLQYDFLTAISSNNNETNCSSNSVEQSIFGDTCSRKNIPQQATFVEPCSSKNVFEKSTLAENGSSNEQSTVGETSNSNNTYEQSPMNEVVAAVPIIVTPISNPSDFLTTKKISKVYFADEVGRKLAEITICERYIINKPGKNACFEHGKEGFHLAKAFQRFDESEDNNLYSFISEYEYEEEGEIISPTISTESTPPNDPVFNTPEEALAIDPNTVVDTLASPITSTDLKHFDDRLCENKESCHSSHSKYSHSSPCRNRLYGSSHFSKGHERKNYDETHHHLPSRDYRRQPATIYHRSPAHDYHHSTSSDKYHGRSQYRSPISYEKNKNFYQSHHSPPRTFCRSPARDYHRSSPSNYHRSSPFNYHRSTTSDKYHGRSQYRSPISYEKNKNFHQSHHSPARTFRRSPARDYHRSSPSNYHRSTTSDKYHGRSQYRSPISYEKKNNDYSYHRRRNSPVKNFSRSLPRDRWY